MDIRVLTYFLMIAREGNITKAAQLLHITQPTLSRQIMQLEEELGVKLFERSSHSVYLSNEGMLFRRRAQELVNIATKAKSELIQVKEELAGIITIGSGEMRSVNELAKFITEFQEKYPLVKFELYSGNNEDIKEKIEQGLLDLGLLLDPVSMVKYDFIRMHTKEQWGAWVHRESRFANYNVIRPGELIGEKIVTVHLNTPVHNELVAWSGEFSEKMESCVNYNVLYNAVIVAREKKGVIVCVKLDCNYENMKFIPFEPKLEISSVLAWKGQQVHSKATTTFIQFIKDKYR